MSAYNLLLLGVNYSIVRVADTSQRFRVAQGSVSCHIQFIIIRTNAEKSCSGRHMAALERRKRNISATLRLNPGWGFGNPVLWFADEH